MSARMLRRALREKEAIELAAGSEEDEVENERPGAGNMFSNLLEEDSVDNEEEEEPVSAPSSSKPQQQQQKSSKKGKKKGGGKAKKTEVPATGNDDEALLSKLMRNMSLKSPATAAAAATAPAPAAAVKEAVMCVDPKHLRAEEELRHIFGSKVIESVNRSTEMAAQKKHRPYQYVHSRKILVQPEPRWPRWSGGVSMEHQETTKDGIMHFKYVYSKEYLDVQRMFEQCVESHDPNTIAALLAAHPYHVDTLLAMVDVYKHVGEHQQASALLERCLYALECAWHPLFYPLGGKCRLDYSRDENKPLFQALFRHMQHLGRRGCHRTALEVCKLLLSLDLDDPTGAKFAVDYYALRAGQYGWLESFVENLCGDKSEALLPNFSFSLAIARFNLEQKEASPDAVPSSDLLQQALMLHPSMLKKLMARTPIKEDPAWSSVLKHPLFAKASAGGPTLEHLINIYVERSYLIWRYPELQAWLKAAATAVVNKPDNGGEAASWACARSEAFPADHNEYQHLSMSEFSDTVQTLPADEPGANNNGGNPAAAANDPTNLRERNLLSVFVESVLPWMNYGSPDQAEGGEEDDEGPL